MTLLHRHPPTFDIRAATRIGRERWAFDSTALRLPGERDYNFLLTASDGTRRVLKIAAADEDASLVQCQHAAMKRLAAAASRFSFPRPIADPSGRTVVTVEDDDGAPYLVSMLEHVPGAPLASVRTRPPALLREVGELLGTVTRALAGFENAAAERVLQWDLQRAPAVIDEHVREVADAETRRRIDGFRRMLDDHAASFETLRTSVIHGDANDYNVLVQSRAGSAVAVAGLIDFGDIVRSWTIAELAIGCAYAMLDEAEPLDAAARVIAGYHTVAPVPADECAALYSLICARLCVSAVLAASQRAAQPDNEYLSISEAPVRTLLGRLESVAADRAHERFAAECAVERGGHRRVQDPNGDPDVESLLARRAAVLGPSLSIAYRRPLHIVRGSKQYLYDASGRAYLDAVNNVAHVGHCHARVVDAVARQAAMLNTNTRYLHELILDYAERLAAMLPEPLRICYFTCSGSEANELALRMARAHTGRRAVIVLDAAYHGNTSSLIELSPYKFDGPGGSGRSPHVHVAPLPDPYRGVHRDADAGARYTHEVRTLIDRLVEQGTPPAAFFAEPLPGCGGQIVPPAGFLSGAFARVRAAGGVCVADEVQTGLGRVGSHFWAFEAQDAVPDIVTVGKPIGNGHPLGALITTPAIAASFANGMEYFNTFGGNPVSCAAGLAVLDIVRDEALQENAETVGNRLLDGLRGLLGRHQPIGEVRGRGLYIGVELVRSREARTPAGDLAGDVVDAMRDRGILLSTDGPDHNVLKIKPPLVFTAADADRLVETLDAVLSGR